MPSISAIERINNINAPPVKQVKNAYSSGWGSLFNTIGTGSNHDLAATEYGAAQAYAVTTGVQRAIAFWQKQLGGLVWHLYDSLTCDIITSSTDRTEPDGAGARTIKSPNLLPMSVSRTQVSGN